MKRIIILLCIMLFQISATLQAETKYPLPYPDSGIYPIGWSESGYFAFAVSNPCGNYGACISYDIYVQNMVTDERVSIHHTFEDAEELSEPLGFSDIWELNYRDISLKLSHYEIEPAEIAIRSIQRLLPNHEITIEVEEIQGSLEPDWDPVGYVLYAYNDKRKRKIIHQIEPEWYIMPPEIIGYIKSPYENRIAILVQGGIGGSENITYYYLVGCQTQSGFK